MEASGDTLWMCIEGKQEIPLPLSAILKLRLSYDPSRIERNRFRCHLYNTGAKCASIHNIHFKGFASFGDRTDTHLPFVRTLISRIAALTPAASSLQALRISSGERTPPSSPPPSVSSQSSYSTFLSPSGHG